MTSAAIQRSSSTGEWTEDGFDWLWKGSKGWRVSTFIKYLFILNKNLTNNYDKDSTRNDDIVEKTALHISGRDAYNLCAATEPVDMNNVLSWLVCGCLAVVLHCHWWLIKLAVLLINSPSSSSSSTYDQVERYCGLVRVTVDDWVSECFSDYSDAITPLL